MADGAIYEQGEDGQRARGALSGTRGPALRSGCATGSTVMRCEKTGDISHEDLEDLSRRFDAEYKGNAAKSHRDDSPSFRGIVSAQTFGTGMSMGASDIVALSDTTQSAVVPRSLSVALLIDGDDISARLQGGDAMNLQRSSALAVSLSDAALMSTDVAAGVSAKTIVVQCHPDMLRDDELSSTVDRLTRSTRVNAITVPARWNVMAASVLAPQTDGLSRRLMGESFALDMVSTMLEILSDHRQRPAILGIRDRSRLQRVRDIIEATPQEEHSLGDLAREAGISVATLKRKFPQVFGTSVIAYLRDVRLDRAHDGICNRGWSIAEAAHFAGYAHASNFTTAFRRRHGVTPGAISAADPSA